MALWRNTDERRLFDQFKTWYEKRHDYAEGVTLTHACIQYRQAFTSWRLHVPTVKWDYYVAMPDEVQSSSSSTLPTPWGRSVSGSRHSSRP